jgi:hypothetical protein
MRINKISAITALAATLFTVTSCKKNVEGGNNEGPEARMGISISFPRNTVTRADDPNATEQDMIVSTIDVFVFNPDGSAAKGNNEALIDHFSPNGDKSKWTLDDDHLITTTSGTKKIYVGINLPGDLKDVATEAALLAVFNKVNDLYSNTDDKKGVSMLSLTTTKDLVAGAADKNIVSIPVLRMAAKAIVTMGAGSFSTTPTGVTEPKFSVSPDMFTVGNTALSIYPVQKKNGSFLVTPGDTNGTKPDAAKTVAILDTDKNPQTEINPFGTAKNLKKSRYIPEHSTSSLMLRGESTYAVIRGEFKPTFYSRVQDDKVVEDIAAPATFVNPLWAIKYSGRIYFTESTTERDNILRVCNLQADSYQEYNPTGNRLYTFYYVFLAEKETDKLAIYRNHIYEVVVNSVKTLGQPGLDTKPQDPDQPVYVADAKLDVEVVVANWDYSFVDTELQ